MSKREYKSFITPPFVLSYPDLWTPKKDGAFKTDQSKYGCQAIWRPTEFGETDKKLWKAICAEIVEAVKEKFKVAGSNRSEIEVALKEKYDGAKMGLRKGEQKADKKGYGPGTVFASLTSNSIPGVIDLRNNTISPEHGNANLIFPGVICRASISVYAYDKSGGRGYALGLGNLQLIKKGPRLDNRQAASETFANAEIDEGWLEQDEATGGELEETFEA